MDKFRSKEDYVAKYMSVQTYCKAKQLGGNGKGRIIESPAMTLNLGG